MAADGTAGPYADEAFAAPFAGIGAGLVEAERYVALALELATADAPAGGDVLADALARARRRVPAGTFASLIVDGRGVAVLAAGPGDPGRRARELALDAQRLIARASVEAKVGVSLPVSERHALPQACVQAAVAVHLASVVRSLPPIVHFDEVEPLAVIARLLGPRDPLEHLPIPLARLLRDSDGRLLAGTVEAYLEESGDAARTAARLNVHRSSLYRRLHRVERLAEVDLRRGADRLSLHLGLLLWRLGGGSVAEVEEDD